MKKLIIVLFFIAMLGSSPSLAQEPCGTPTPTPTPIVTPTPTPTPAPTPPPVPTSPWPWPAIRQQQFLGPITGVPAYLSYTIQANRMYFVPVRVETPSPYDRLWLSVVTGVGGGKARMALWSDCFNIPCNLIEETPEVDLSTAGMKNGAFVSARQPPSGQYWISVVSNVNVSIRGMAANSAYHFVLGINNANPTGAASVDTHLSALFTYGPMPSTPPMGPYKSGTLPLLLLGINPSAYGGQ